MLKLCPNCNQSLPVKNFNWKIKGRRRASYCRSCSREFIKNHYNKNKKYYITKAKERNAHTRSQVLQFLGKYLTSHPCVDCGEKDVRVLDFDHQDRTKKIATVSDFVKNRQSLTKLLVEIEKCEVRCANCHRKKTAKEINSWKQKFAPVA